MRFSFSATTIASISGTAYLSTTASTGLAASVSYAYDNTGSIRAAKKPKGTECSFVNGFKANQFTDTGILGCSLGEICIEDQTSSAGGRCVKEDAFVDVHRHLETCTYSNGTSGTKCVGTSACDSSVDTDKVGCGSCIGNKACGSWTGDVTIGEGSCLGNEACYDMTAASPIAIADGSCHDNVACKYNRGKHSRQNNCLHVS